MSSTLPFVSVIVPFFNAKSTLPTLLDSLLNQSYPKDRFEIILVDDRSTDESLGIAMRIRKLNREAENVKILRCDQRSGPAKARNLGIKNSKGEIIAFTDADTNPDRNWLKELVKAFTSNEVGGVAGRVITDFHELLYPLRVAPVSKYVTCNITYRRDVLTQCGLFDERFRYPFREDGDLAYKVLKRGYRIDFSEKAVVYHPVKKMQLRDLYKISKYHIYDVLLYKKHQELAWQYIGRLVIKGFTLNGLAFLLALLTLILLAFTLTLLYYGLLMVSLTTLIIILITIIKKLKYESSINDAIKASMYHLIYLMSIEIGRIIGSIKFKKFLL